MVCHREDDVWMRLFLAAFAAVVVFHVDAASSQGANARKVGVILQGGSWYEVIEGLRDGLRGIGFEEGKQYALDIRDMHGELRAVEQEAADQSGEDDKHNHEANDPHGCGSKAGMASR